LVIPPPVPLTVRVDTPVLVPDALVRVNVLVPFPGAATLCGLKLALIPDGNPDTERATAALNPPSACAVRVIDTLPLAETDVEVVLPDKVKPGTFTVSGFVCRTPPPLAVTASKYAPGATLDAAMSVSVLVPEPGSAKLAGLRLAVIPAGKPVTVSATAALNEFAGTVVRLTLVL